MSYNPRQDTEETFTKDTGFPGSTLPPGPGYVLDPSGKIVVGNSTYYPSTTGGKLDLFSRTGAVENPPAVGRSGGEPMYSVSQHKWTTSPVVETPAQQPTEPTPYSVVDQQLATLKNRFFEQAKRLRDSGLPPEQHNKILAGMQADYDNEKYKLSDVRTQLDGIQSAIKSGVVDPTLGQQTMWKIAAPHMAGAFRPPAQEPRGRMTPGELTAYGDEFEESRKRARTDSSLWPGKEYNPEILKNEYFINRVKSGYDNQMNADEKRAFDVKWDYVIAASPEADKVWREVVAGDPNLIAARTYDSQLLGAAAKKVTGKKISPFAQGVNMPTEKDSRIGTIVTKGGKQWKIVSIAPDGEPLVEAIR